MTMSAQCVILKIDLVSGQWLLRRWQLSHEDLRQMVGGQQFLRFLAK